MSSFGLKTETEVSDLARRLAPFLENVAEYRSAANLLSALAAQTTQVSDDVLLRVEEISEDIQSDVARFGDLKKSLRNPTSTDLALTTEVEDALRLILLEVTELGTRLYSARSAI